MCTGHFTKATRIPIDNPGIHLGPAPAVVRTLEAWLDPNVLLHAMPCAKFDLLIIIVNIYLNSDPPRAWAPPTTHGHQRATAVPTPRRIGYNGTMPHAVMYRDMAHGARAMTYGAMLGIHSHVHVLVRYSSYVLKLTPGYFEPSPWLHGQGISQTPCIAHSPSVRRHH